MNISPATVSDIPQLCDLLELLFSEEAEFHPNRAVQSAGLRQIIKSPDRGQILVLRNATSVIGMVNLLFTISTALGGRVAILEDMVIHPALRGKGYGSRLLLAAISFARSTECHRITLLTDRTNEAAQRFYRRHGFRVSAMIPLRLLLTAQLINPCARERNYRGLFEAEEYRLVSDFFGSRPECEPTSLLHLRALASELGIGDILLKNESSRK